MHFSKKKNARLLNLLFLFPEKVQSSSCQNKKLRTLIQPLDPVGSNFSGFGAVPGILHRAWACVGLLGKLAQGYRAIEIL